MSDGIASKYLRVSSDYIFQTDGRVDGNDFQQSLATNGMCLHGEHSTLIVIQQQMDEFE